MRNTILKTSAYLLWLLPLGACEKDEVAPRIPVPTEFATQAEAKVFFFDLVDQHTRAMIAHDSAFFAGFYAPGYYNCTPAGEINNKAADIQILLSRPWVSVERVAPQLDVFAQASSVASLVITNRNKVRTPAGVQETYVRRAFHFQKLDGKWQAIASQGTVVQARFVGQ